MSRTVDFISKCRLIHGDKYNLSKVEYKNQLIKVYIGCNDCGDWSWRTPKQILKCGCKVCENRKKALSRIYTKEMVVEKSIFTEYDYSLLPEFIKADDDITIICNIHGKFNTTRKRLINSKQGCPECGKIKSSLSKKYTPEEYFKKAIVKHNGKYKYDGIYNGCYEDINYFCSEHGWKKIKAYAHLSGRGCPDCLYKNQNIVMKELKKYVKVETEKKFDTLVFKNNLRIDFWLTDYNIAVEYNGEQHYKNKFNLSLHEWHEQKHRDWLKRKWCYKNGYRLFIIKYSDNITEKVSELLKSLNIG